MKRVLQGGAAFSVALGAVFTGGAAAEATEGIEKSVSTFTSESCVKEVEEIAATTKANVEDGLPLCSGTAVLEESAPITATVSEIEAYADSVQLPEEDRNVLVRAAQARGISYRNWSHAYYSGSNYEKHTGKTYWNGSKAWVASYSGYAGSHKCHTEGSWAVGWTTTVIGCNKPGAASTADATYRFDSSLGWQGAPITLSVGLHYKTTAKGASSGSQVGG